MFFNLIGSLGLFLLGMWLMTEGLKLAGGKALETLLGEWTSTRFRGLASGVLITGLVQSSSAVTIATIGFVNASLMPFRQAVWVVFGSNVGTTFTAWIVTFFGFSVDIKLLTFPLIGVGAACRIFFPYERIKALGMALAGFGLLFMGINELNDNFSFYANQINIQLILSSSGHPTFWALLIGFVLTLLTQSSSAAIAIILTAVASGVTDLAIAAAAVIGANIGTTSTALLASVGASADAKRLAWAHVFFNALTAFLALVALPIFVSLVSFMVDETAMAGNIVLMLAIFHTCFNLLGVILMWPFEPKMSRWLLSHFKILSGSQKHVLHLDANAATIPDLAIRTMTNELSSLLREIDDLDLPESNLTINSRNKSQALNNSIIELNGFISLALKSGLTEQHGNQLTLGLSVSHYLHNAVRTYNEIIQTCLVISNQTLSIPKQLYIWFNKVNNFNHLLHHGDLVLQHEQLTELKQNYKQIKNQLLRVAIDDRLNIDTIDNVLQAASLARRFIEQVSQAAEAYQLLVHANDDENTVRSIPSAQEHVELDNGQPR